MVEETNEEIDVRDEHGKKFKDFKKEFYESFEKIVAPVFYQTQATYMSKLKKADIKMVNDAANQVGVDRKGFGNYIHELKK